MKINGFKSWLCRIPPASPWEDATNRVQALELIVVELTTDTGLSGWGLTYTVDVGGTAIRALADDYLSNLVVDMDPLMPEAIWRRLATQSRRLGSGVNTIAVAAIDMAIWDIAAKHYGAPLHILLGGARPQIETYISEINLAASDTPDELARRVADYARQGYRAAKIKIGRETLEEDIERISKARDALGPGGKLMVDLNQKWSTAQAIQNARALEGTGIAWLEEPLVRHDVAGHAALRRATSLPIALGESLYSKFEFLEFLKNDAVDIVQADVAFVGGVTEWVKIAHLAESFGRPIAPHYMAEISLPLLCAVPNGFMLENVIGGSLHELGLTESAPAISNGVATPSPLPGHGISFDRTSLDRLQTSAADVRAGFRGGSK